MPLKIVMMMQHKKIHDIEIMIILILVHTSIMIMIMIMIKGAQDIDCVGQEHVY